MKNRRTYLRLFCLLAASLFLSASSWAQNGPGWQVVKADWGAGKRWMDVTNQVRRLLTGNGRVTVNNANMGGDPAYGVYKILRIRAQNSQGQFQQFTYKEGDTIDARQFYNPGRPGFPPPNPGSGNRSLQITRAYYGLNNRTSDVTQILRGMVRNGTLALQVNNNNLGGDPARGADKVLTVIYRFQGREQTATVKEGNVLRIP
jgi:hypothetical protein